MVVHMLIKLFFWRYGRSAWQYDVLCLLILAFIFLTPQRWFQNGELHPSATHQNPGSTIFILPETSDREVILDRQDIEQRVRNATKNPALTVKGFRPQYNAGGKLVAYEVDIQ